MFLIVGLGNPGIKYALNRHNIGFMVVDALADHFGVRKPTTEEKAEVFKVQTPQALLVKPQTFMNLSGQSVQPLMSYYKIEMPNLLVLHDEVDIPFGTLKFQKARGHGGHNGIRNIHELLGTNEYARLKIGVGRSPIPQMETSDWVLQNFPKEQMNELGEFIGRAGEAVLDFIELGFERAQNKHNS